MPQENLHCHCRVGPVADSTAQLQRHIHIPRRSLAVLGTIVLLQAIVWWVFRETACGEVDDGGNEVNNAENGGEPDRELRWV